MLKMIATSGFLTALECTKFVFGRGSASDPATGAYSAPPDSLAGFPTSKGRGGKESRNTASISSCVHPCWITQYDDSEQARLTEKFFGYFSCVFCILCLCVR